MSALFGESNRVPRLSGQEEIVLTYLMRGITNKSIARELGIAEATVKVYVKNLLHKLRVQNRTQAAIWGINRSAVMTVIGSASAVGGGLSDGD